MTPTLRAFLLVTDLGLLAYWSLTALAALGLVALPADWMYSGYGDPLIAQWNWSFLPLDVLLSILGLLATRLSARGDARWRRLSTLSLTMTVCAGLMALSFWTIRGEFSPSWWAVNLYLGLWPLAFLIRGFAQAE